jgi:4'-phosphopantetheinyl transferase
MLNKDFVSAKVKVEMIEIWCLNIGLINQMLFNQYLDILPEEVKREVTRYRFSQDQKFKLFGKILVQHYYKFNDRELQWSAWKTDIKGKPYIQDGKKFSITHSGDYVCVAFSDVEVGLDIEKISPLDYEALINLLHIEEQVYINQSVCKLSAFYYVWTRKEAFCKANGEGILRGLKKESCLESIYYDNSEWNIISLDYPSSYKLSICSQFKDPQILLWEIHL